MPDIPYEPRTYSFIILIIITLGVTISLIDRHFLCHSSVFLESCVLLESMKHLEVSSLNLRLIGKLNEFTPNLDAESELSEGPQIREAWGKLIPNLHLVTHYSQLLHSNGIWRTNLLLNEYKAFLRPTAFPSLTVHTVVTNFASVLQDFLLVSNTLSNTTQLAIQNLNFVQALILVARKRLQVETKQQGLLQRFLNRLLGNGWLMRRESELATCERAYLIVEAIAPFLSDVKVKNERYNSNLVALLASISNANNPTEGDTGRLRLLMLISSLFQCRS